MSKFMTLMRILYTTSAVSVMLGNIFVLCTCRNLVDNKVAIATFDAILMLQGIIS
jgi:hypothetical protein